MYMSSPVLTGAAEPQRVEQLVLPEGFRNSLTKARIHLLSCEMPSI